MLQIHRCDVIGYKIQYNTLMEAVQSRIEGENEAVELYREILAHSIFKIITD